MAWSSGARQIFVRFALFFLACLIMGLVALIPQRAAEAATLVVDTISDANLTACTGAANDCSLRGAIMVANSTGGLDTISFDSAVFASPQTITLTSSLPSISGDLTINGPSAALLTVDGASTYQAINIASGVTVSINGLTINHSSAGGSSGGAIFNQSGSTLTITNSAIINSQAALGGGIWSGGTLTILNSTISGNTSTTNAGGISNIGTLTLINSTVAGNSAGRGGGLYSFNQMTVTNSTISGNAASNSGGGLFVFGGTTTLNNSIVANSTSGGECSRSASTINASNSLIEDGLGCLNGTNVSNLTGDPNLGALTGNPGYYPLILGSIAVNTGNNALAKDAGGSMLTTDQIGNPRIRNGLVDLGAVELAYFLDLKVDTTSDANLVTCSTAANDCSLRGAIALANGRTGTDTIPFDSTVFATPQTITLTSSLPSITSSMNINGPGASLLTVDGASTYQAINIASGVTVSLNGLTINHSSAGGGSGGAIFNQTGSTLTITNSAITNSQAALGGGIWSGGTLTILNSAISGNTSTTNAGGIANIGTLTLINSTVAGNSAGRGGGLYSFNQMTVTNSTISGNAASDSGSGLFVFGGTTTLNNSIVANSTSGGECSRSAGTINASNSLVEDGLGCLNGTNTSNLTGDPALNGDLTLSSTSIAINVGDNSLIPSGITTDLAGNPRIQQGTVDMGAYESPYIAPVAQIAFGQQPTDTTANQTISPAVTVQLLNVRGNLVTTASASVSLAISTNPGGGSLGGTATVSAINGVATFNDLSINTVGTGYTLDASVIGLANVTSSPFNITASSIPVTIDRTRAQLVITDDVNAVAEGATIGDRFAFQLTQAPTADVTVTFSSTDPTQLQMIDFTVIGRYQSVGSYSVTFSATNATGAHTVPWNTPVVVNLYGVPDTVAEGVQTYGIHFAFSSSDPAYNNLAAPDQPVKVYDAGVTNSPTSLTLAEGTSGSYTVVLERAADGQRQCTAQRRHLHRQPRCVRQRIGGLEHQSQSVHGLGIRRSEFARAERDCAGRDHPRDRSQLHDGQSGQPGDAANRQRWHTEHSRAGWCCAEQQQCAAALGRSARHTVKVNH